MNAKTIVNTAAGILNTHLTSGGDVSRLLAGADRGAVIQLVNDILGAVADGGRLVAAIDSDDALLGFVPRSSIPLPDPPPPAQKKAPPRSPDS